MLTHTLLLTITSTYSTQDQTIAFPEAGKPKEKTQVAGNINV